MTKHFHFDPHLDLRRKLYDEFDPQAPREARTWLRAQTERTVFLDEAEGFAMDRIEAEIKRYNARRESNGGAGMIPVDLQIDMRIRYVKRFLAVVRKSSRCPMSAAWTAERREPMRRLMQERFETEHVKGEWESSTVHVPTHVRTEADFRRFVADLNKKAKVRGDFVRFRSVENEDCF